MKYTQKKKLKSCGQFCYVIIVLLLINLGFPLNGCAQQEDFEWQEIELIDSLKYGAFSTSHIPFIKYPPANLFDGDFNTCWVVGNASDEGNPGIYIVIPEGSRYLNIFSGYGKSPGLHQENSCPVKIKLSYYAAINPDGFVSEITTVYKALKFKKEQILDIDDTFTVQNIAMNYSKDDMDIFADSTFSYFKKSFSLPPGRRDMILKLEVLDNRIGKKYDDICISELYFDNRVIVPNRENEKIVELKISDTDDTLLKDTNERQNVLVIRDSTSVLQLIESSDDKQWAILIQMPREVGGRVDTFYLLVNTISGEIVNSRLEKSRGYIDGMEIYFDDDGRGSLLLRSFMDDDFIIYLN